MYSKTTTVVNPSGLHARPVMLVVQKAGEFASKVYVRNVTTDSEPKDAKSILGVMGLSMSCGTDVEISAEGPDETEAVDAIVALIESGCGE